jgi:hypothetical protein
MALLGSAVIQSLYQEYQDIELAYTKDVAAGLGLLPGESSFKWQGTIYPCVVHSGSFNAAKVLVKLSGSQWRSIEAGSKLTTLTMTMLASKTGRRELIAINGTLETLQRPSSSSEMSVLMGITYSHRPPENFVSVQGSYLGLKKEANQRTEDRIALTPDNRELVGLANLNTVVTVDHIERKCLLRDLSYNGARAILTGVAPFLVDKPFTLQVPLADGPVHLPGKIVRADPVEGHKGLAVIAMGYHTDLVSIDYLKTIQKAIKLGLTVKTGRGPTITQTAEPQTSTINMRTLKVDRAR